MESKGIGATGILRLDHRDIGPLAGWHLNPQTLDLTTVLDVLALEELQTCDHDRNGRMVVDIDNVSIPTQAHFRSGVDRLARGRHENGTAITGACGQHASEREDFSANDFSHADAAT
jgi:hypothetical protein